MVTNKRNIVAAGIGMCFLVASNDFVNLPFCTSEPSEHNFGNWRLENREATTLEMLELEEKAWRRTKAVYKEVLKCIATHKNDITQLILALSTIIRMIPQQRSLEVMRGQKLITVARTQQQRYGY